MKENLTEEQIKLSLIHLDSKLKKINRKYERINSGGCAYFAVALSRKLKKMGMDPEMLVISDKDLAGYVNNAPDHVTLGSAYENGMRMMHVLLKVGEVFVDSTGIRRTLSGTSWSKYKVGSVKKEKEAVVKGWLKEKERWNPAFNQNQLKFMFKDIKNIQL